jgi:dephospho-CoA kinase
MKEVSKSNFKLGVTGGIGSGKSSVCKVFRLLGIPVFAADEEARLIMENDKGLAMRLNSLTGRDLYLSGSLDRVLLASIIFNNRSLLEKVNSLVHPVVFERFNYWVEKQSSPYVIMEAAILLESGASSLVDRIAVVVAPVEERIERVIQRNDLTREQVLERVRNQMDDETRIKSSHYIIKNSENDMLIPAVLRLHEEILEFINTLN